MSKDKLIPELRFPEFLENDEWIGTTLSEISPSIFDGTHQTPKYTDEGIPFFSVENIVSGSKNKFISREDYIEATKKNKPEKGDVLVTRIGSIGISKVVDWDYEFSIYVTLAVIKKSDQFIPQYLASYIQSSRFQKEILRRSLLKAAPQKINMNELRECEVLLPPDEEKKEQQKIASCLSSLDELIAAHNDKLAALKDHKKGLLQNLFPQSGTGLKRSEDGQDDALKSKDQNILDILPSKKSCSDKLPRLRFPEFEGDGEWVKKELSEVSKIITGSTPNTKVPECYDGDIMFVSPADISNNKYVESSGKTLSVEGFEKTRKIKANSVMFVCIGSTIGKVAMNKYDCATNQQINSLIPNNENSGDFLYSNLELNAFKISGIAGNQAVPIINKTLFSSVKLKFPPTKKEQQKIASCLSAVDELITAQQEKTEQLQQHKKGLMQGLFPNIER